MAVYRTRRRLLEYTNADSSLNPEVQTGRKPTAILTDCGQREYHFCVALNPKVQGSSPWAGTTKSQYSKSLSRGFRAATINRHYSQTVAKLASSAQIRWLGAEVTMRGVFVAARTGSGWRPSISAGLMASGLRLLRSRRSHPQPWAWFADRRVGPLRDTALHSPQLLDALMR